jgi:hypothetical protein
MADLTGCLAKIERAREHLDVLEVELEAFLHAEPPPIGVSQTQLDDESGWYYAYAIVERPPPLRLGVILGDALHNARSALDHLIWQLVLLNGAAPTRDNAFPIVFRVADWDAAKSRRLVGLSVEQQAHLDRLQPYNCGDPEQARATYLAVLSQLSNVDKHQIVHPAIASLLDPLSVPDGAQFVVVRGGGEVGLQQFMPRQRLDHGAVLMRGRVEGATAATEVEVQGKVPVDIAFGELLVPLAALKHIPDLVGKVVQTFAGDFPG